MTIDKLTVSTNYSEIKCYFNPTKPEIMVYRWRFD